MVAIAYFLGARLGLDQLSASSGVAVFWPASGIALGILVLLGWRASPPLVIGVIVGTVAANLMSDRSFLASLLKGFCNAAEPFIAAWLLERWFGRLFTFADLQRVAGFVAAVGLATAVSATGGAAVSLLHSAAPYWDVWRGWFLSDIVGGVVVAPLVIGLGQMWREPPSRGEWIEGVGALALFTLIVMFVETYPTRSWLSFSPGIMLLPPLLWLAARCPPTFPIASAFVASVLVICATTYGVGRFGDAGVPMLDRVRGAQAFVVTGTIFTLGLVALFAQRKEAEEKLRRSQAQLAKKSAALARLHDISSRLWLKGDLHQALDEILAGAIELLGADMGTIRIWDSARGTLRIEAHQGFKRDCLDIFRQIPAVGNPPCERALQLGERMIINDVEADRLFAPYRLLARAAGYRAMQSTPILSREGAPLGMLATHFRSVHKPNEQDLRLLDLYVRQAADIIERHKADDALRESEERLRLAQLSTGIGIWDNNLRTGKMTWTPELAAIFGLEPGAVRSYSDFRERVHPNDIAPVEENRDAAIRRRETFSNEFRIIRPDGQVRWILSLGGAFYDEVTGEPIRVFGNNVDITERKQTETRLSDALEAGQVVAFAWDAANRRSLRSDNADRILGVVEGSHFLRQVHPDDRAMFKAGLDAISPEKPSYALTFRFVRSDGRLIWLEETAKGEFDSAAKLSCIRGLTRDITDRKRAEQALADLDVQLTLAGRAGLVGTYAYDAGAEKAQISPGYAAIHDLPDGTTEITRNAWLARVHPEDVERLEVLRDQAFQQRRREYKMDYRIARAGEIRWIESRTFISYNSDSHPKRVIGVNIDVTERKRAEERQRVLVAELDHRVKNVLATVSAVVSHTRQGSSSMASFAAALEGRIRSMATTHELLSSGLWEGISLAELIRRELAPYATRSNIEIHGPEVVLKSEAGQAIAMVLHELVTNAAKYGALSTKNGRVLIRWDQRPNGHARLKLVLEWQEVGGPPVVNSGKASYGMTTIRDLIPYEFGGTVDLVLPPEGVRCQLELPADWLRDHGEPVSESIGQASPQAASA